MQPFSIGIKASSLLGFSSKSWNREKTRTKMRKKVFRVPNTDLRTSEVTLASNASGVKEPVSAVGVCVAMTAY